MRNFDSSYTNEIFPGTQLLIQILSAGADLKSGHAVAQVRRYSVGRNGCALAVPTLLGLSVQGLIFAKMWVRKNVIVLKKFVWNYISHFYTDF